MGKMICDKTAVIAANIATFISSFVFFICIYNVKHKGFVVNMAFLFEHKR